jgi:hypothetical protein
MSRPAADPVAYKAALELVRRIDDGTLYLWRDGALLMTLEDAVRAILKDELDSQQESCYD